MSRKEVEELSSKLQRAQNLLTALLPDVDLNSPTSDALALSRLQKPVTKSPVTVDTGRRPLPATARSLPLEEDLHLETILEATGRLDLDELGNWTYQGHGSSSAFVRRLGGKFESPASDTNHEISAMLKFRSMPESTSRLQTQRLYHANARCMALLRSPRGRLLSIWYRLL